MDDKEQEAPAADILGIGTRTLYRKVKEYGLAGANEPEPADEAEGTNAADKSAG